jgi:hypothetical protein
MATLAKGYTFGATEEVTAAKLHALIDSGTCTGIVAADITDGVITNAKISDVSGAKFTNLASIPAGAGSIPAVNITGKANSGANSDITSLTGLTTALSTAQGGTGATANANAASGVVILDASSKLPAVDGSQLTSVGYTDRGNAGSVDKSDFTTDGAAHDWDVSAIVGASSKLVLISVTLTDGAAGNYLQFREKGNATWLNSSYVTTQAANVPNNQMVIVSCNSSGVIEYAGTNTTFTTIEATICGWWK